MAREIEFNVKVDVATAKKNLDELNKSFDASEQLVNDLEKELIQLNKELTNISGNTGVQASQRKKLNQRIKETKNAIAEEKNALKGINLERKQTNKLIKDNEVATADFGGAIKILDKATGGSVTQVKNLTSSVAGATKGFNLLKVAVIGTGIGALVIAVVSLIQAFKRSEAGQDRFAKILGVIGSITNVLGDRLASLGEGIINLFTNPVESIKNFAKTLKSFVTDRINNVIESVGLLGSAIQKIFQRDFKGALSDATNSFVKLQEGINPAVIATKALANATKDVVKEMNAEAKIAAQIADDRAKANKLERELVVEVAEGRRKINDLRLKAEDREKFSATERIKLLREAQALEDELAEKQIEAKELVINAMKQEQAISLTTREEKDALAKLEAELINLETRKLRGQRLLQTQITTAVNQERAEKEKAVKEEEQRQKDLAEFSKTVREANAQNEDEQRELELAKIKEHFENLINSELANNEQKLALQDSLNEALAKKQAEFDKQDADRKKALEEKNDAEVQAKLDKEAEIEAQRIALRQETFDNAVQLAGEETALGKALLLAKQIILAKEFILQAKEQIQDAKALAVKGKNKVAEVTLEGAEASTQVAGSITKATNTAPPPFNIPFILTAIATGASVMSAVKSAIKATKSAASKAGASAGGATTPDSRPSVSAPAFNVVGASGTNQLAETIAEKQQQPIKAFVVSSEVTTQQALDRQTEDTASI